MKKKPSFSAVTAFAPATVANVAVGFDILGFAVRDLGETARVELLRDHQSDRPHIVLDPVPGYVGLPLDPKKNTASVGLLRLLNEKKLKVTLRVSLNKTIPIGSGLGGSATSAVASLVAANEVLGLRLSDQELLDYALTGEEAASASRHADNIAPCLFGGLVFAGQAAELPSGFCVERIRTPKNVQVVLLLPDLQIQTRESRARLAPMISLKAHIAQSTALAGFILGCMKSDSTLMARYLNDQVIEPQRASALPGFYDFQKVALQVGALGASFSGSGPALFALTLSRAAASRVLKSWLALASQRGLSLHGTWISSISPKGARVIKRER